MRKFRESWTKRGILLVAWPRATDEKALVCGTCPGFPFFSPSVLYILSRFHAMLEEWLKIFLQTSFGLFGSVRGLTSKEGFKEEPI